MRLRRKVQQDAMCLRARQRVGAVGGGGAPMTGSGVAREGGGCLLFPPWGEVMRGREWGSRRGSRGNNRGKQRLHEEGQGPLQGRLGYGGGTWLCNMPSSAGRSRAVLHAVPAELRGCCGKGMCRGCLCDAASAARGWQRSASPALQANRSIRTDTTRPPITCSRVNGWQGTE